MTNVLALERIARELVGALGRLGIPADESPVDSGAPWIRRVNVWAPAEAVTEENPNLNRYPQASIVIADNDRYHDISWGGNYEHQRPLNTPVADLASAIVATLSDEVRAVLPDGPEKWVPEAIAEQEAYLARMKEAKK